MPNWSKLSFQAKTMKLKSVNILAIRQVIIEKLASGYFKGMNSKIFLPFTPFRHLMQIQIDPFSIDEFFGHYLYYRIL